MTIQWLINGETHPTMPIRSTPEAWSQLVKSVGGHGQTGSTIGITLPEYETVRFTTGIDLEACLDAGWTGKNLRNNAQLSLQLSNLTKNGELTSSSADAIRKVFILMYHDCILNIRDSGVEFLD